MPNLTELRFVVECTWGHYYEPIAAFNVETVARHYMRDCQLQAPPQLRYRVTTIPETNPTREG